jgi:CRP/FNR family transcriptional regulator
LAPHELLRLNRIVTEVRLTKNQPVFHESDSARYFFSVSRGVVRTSKAQPDGRRQVTGFLHPGYFIGLSYAETYIYSADAVNEVSLYRFPMNGMIEIFDQIPKLEHFLLKQTANELVAAQDQMLLLGCKTAKERMASFLLGLPSRSGPGGASSTEVDLAMSRTDIADYLGLTVESVSRALTRLKEEGLIEVPKIHYVVIGDRGALEEIAEGS